MADVGTWPHWYSLAWLIVWPVFLWIGSKAPAVKSGGADAHPQAIS